MREIRGWNIGEVVTANYMRLNTANLLEQTGSTGEANLPCIYNGLTLASQTGTGGDTVTFNPGIARCQDLPLSVFTYLPPNAYGESYPCFIDISTLDANETIVLSTGITSGYIVATFSISPVTPNAVNYVVTGSLLQIATGAYNPAHQVRLCSFIYALSVFTLDFTPGSSRDTDLTGLGGMQWDYENSSLVIDMPASQVGTSIVLKQNTKVDAILNVNTISDLAGTGPVDFSQGITTNSFVAPTRQKFLTGSGTYILPTIPRSPLYLHVISVGGGGGGSGGGNTGSTNGGNGLDSTFGTILTAGGGDGGIYNGDGGFGNGASIGLPAYGFVLQGQRGQSGQLLITNTSDVQSELFGGNGGQNFCGGGGQGGKFGTGPIGAGSNASINSGCGGGGGGVRTSPTNTTISGSGGGAGGYSDAIIPNPAATYTFQVGAPGLGGISNGSGSDGGSGGEGFIIVTEHYQ